MRTLFLLSVAITCCLLAGLEARTWTSLNGKTMEAEFVESDGTKVTILRSDGRKYTVALEKFSEADREFVAERRKKGDAGSKSEKAEVTGEISDPKDGEKVTREFAVKGRTRGAPDGFVTLLFRSNPKDQFLFPHYEYSKANRSFTTYIRHEKKDSTEWEVHLYVLPEDAAKKLVSWVKKAFTLGNAGQKDKIELFDASLTDDAIHLGTRKYYLETD